MMRSAAGLTLLLMASATAGFLAYRYFLPLETGPVAVGASEAVAPQVLPAFALPDPQGLMRSSDEWQGRPLLVNFWATWCAPCRREIPLLKELQREYAELDLQVIGIALDYPDAVQEFAEDMGINYPILVGEQEAMELAEQFGAEFIALPFTVFSGSDGRILEIHFGELHRDQAEAVLEVVRETRAGRVDP